MSTSMDDLERGLGVIRQQTELEPELGLVLGSGLGFLAEQVTDAVVIGYQRLPGFPVSTVEGHVGRLVVGHLAGKKVAIMQGRFHFYEGYSMEQIAMGVRLLAKLGAKRLILTNAAGGIRDDLRPGDLMLIRDHLNLMGHHPLIGPNLDELGPRFPDMSQAYSPMLREQAMRVTQRQGVRLKEGVYAALCGPSYETPAEVRMLKLLGADAVGMSTVPEVIAACHMGLDVLGLSFISNLAAGLSDQSLCHQEIEQIVHRAAGQLSDLIHLLVSELG